MSQSLDFPPLPPLTSPPTPDEVATLLHHIKHDLVGFMQAVKMGLDLLMRESLDRDTQVEVIELVQANVERGIAYGRFLEGYARDLEGVQPAPPNEAPATLDGDE